MFSISTVAKPGLVAGNSLLRSLGPLDEIIRAGTDPVSPASAAAFRIIFGLVGLFAVVRFAANGWISELYIQPTHHFTYYGFSWVQPWPGWGMYLHFALLGLASLGVALGYRYRLSITAFFLLFTYVELIDKTTYLNHYYFISLASFIMIFLPLHRAYSLDARRLPVDKSPPTIPRAALWMLQAEVGIVYFFAGVAKLNSDWLLHAQPLGIWLFNSTNTPLIGPFLREPSLPYLMSWTGAFFDLTIVGWLLWNRSRPVAYAVLVAFHALTALIFPPIGIFPLIMTGAALIFFRPDWPIRLARSLRPSLVGNGSSQVQKPAQTLAKPWGARAALLFGLAFLAVQLIIPLRHFTYPGNVRWTEEGYRFSWRVLVTEKTGLVKFRVTSNGFNEGWLVYPERYLTPLQVERMAYQPDMILATAHIIRDDYLARGYEGVEVRADAFVAFNGRPATRLIDPDVNLARIAPGLGSKGWVLPPPTGPPLN